MLTYAVEWHAGLIHNEIYEDAVTDTATSSDRKLSYEQRWVRVHVLHVTATIVVWRSKNFVLFCRLHAYQFDI
jgi:hypothetical protein